MNLPRWLAQITGSVADLHYLPHLFPSGEVYVLVEGDNYFLAGSRLNSIDSEPAVRDLAESELDLIVAATKLIVGKLTRPEVSVIYQIDTDGTRHAYAPGSVFNLELRYKLTNDDTALHAGLTRAQRLAMGGRSQPALLTAMQLWSDETRTWPRLYRVLEEIESALAGVQVDALGFCSANERQRFARSSNSPAAAGKDARHADLGHQPPRNPLTLAQANEFISSLLACAIEKYSSLPGGE